MSFTTKQPHCADFCEVCLYRLKTTNECTDDLELDRWYTLDQAIALLDVDDALAGAKRLNKLIEKNCLEEGHFRVGLDDPL